MPFPRVTTVHPSRAINGGRIAIHGTDFPVDRDQLPAVHVGDKRARVVFASPSRLDVIVPAGPASSGLVPVHVEAANGEAPTVEIAATFATGLHQVDNPIFDREGNLYVTYSGTRGQQVPVSIFRVRPNGTRETFSSGVVNPTSMAIDADGVIYMSSRFEGTVYRLMPDGSVEPFATDLGVACGLAFSWDGTLFVGDRSGTIFSVDRSGRATTFASLPPSVAAFHLAVGREPALYVTGPTLSSYDVVYRIDERGAVGIHSPVFGRPQGLAFDAAGTLFVVEALAGASGLYRLGAGEPELVLAGPVLVGLAFEPNGGLVVCTNDTAFRLPRST
jgi:hypothetical protein